MAQGTDEQLQADVRNDQSKNPIIILQKKRGSSVVEKQNASKLTPANNLEGSISIGGAETNNIITQSSDNVKVGFVSAFITTRKTANFAVCFVNSNIFSRTEHTRYITGIINENIRVFIHFFAINGYYFLNLCLARHK